MPSDVQRDQVRRLQTQGGQIVEVLPREEYEQEHIAGAVSLPLGELSRTTAERVLVRGKPIIVYCQDVE
jgi:rhodanese-related sulfurtransferase